ncbi:MAG: fasciclin domain-containing protein, partial [Carboxylicivirga sp.]|nr:fasciclin domain-containing protein [Carboxylicivirga sp.]
MNLLYSVFNRAMIIVVALALFNQTHAQTLKATESTSSIKFNHLAFINNLVEELVDNAPYTVFLPSEAALTALTNEQKSQLFAHPYLELIDLIKGHMVSGVITSENLKDGQALTALNGNKLFIRQEGDSWYVNNVLISIVDIHLKHSVFHRVEGILFRPETVVDIIVNSADHTILETAVIEAELVDALSAEGPFTVFAPTDEAFGNLPE